MHLRRTVIHCRNPLLSRITSLLLNPRRIPFSSSTPPKPPTTTTTTTTEWTDDIDYLDESGSLLFSGKGVRPLDPSIDGPAVPDSAAASKIAETVNRWRWGPDMESRLDNLHFPPKPSHVHRALLHIDDLDSSMGLFRWARRQDWYSPSADTYSFLFDKMDREGDYDGVQSLFDDLIDDNDTRPFPVSASNRAVRSLVRAGRLEVSFCCFKKMHEKFGVESLEAKTLNSLIELFLNRGLHYKAFEIYEAMEASKILLEAEVYELMIPCLAKSGRLDAAMKMFDEMKMRGVRPSLAVFTSMVDSLGKAGRLDASKRVYDEMGVHGFRPSVVMFASLIESFVKAGKLDSAMRVWDEMKSSGFRPNFALCTLIVESHAKSGKLERAMSIFSEMEKVGFLPTPSTYSCLLEMHASTGQVDSAMKIYNSMMGLGLKPGLNTYTSLLMVLANKKLIDVAAKVLLEMSSVGYPVDIYASDVLMVYIKDGSVDLALRWLRFMGSSGIRTNNFIIRQLFESCMKSGLYESAKPLLVTYVNSAGNVDLVLYTSILAHLVRCQEENSERQIMLILGATKHKAHSFMCGLFTGPERRNKPVLTFVREFFQGIDHEAEEGPARYFINVLLNYLVLMGQLNRARCVWKVAYENKLFPKAIVFDEHIAWSLDVRNLSVGAALIAVVHTLHRFRKRMLYYGVVPRRIKLVTGSTLKVVVAEMLSSVDSPFEVSKVVLRSPGDSVLEWFKKPIVQQFLLNEIPSRGDVLMHKLNVLFPSSVPEVRSLYPQKPWSVPRAI